MESTEISPSAASKLKSIVSQNPALPIGVIAFTAIVGHGIFKFKKRNIRPSLFIINYRLAAQGTLIGCITLGLLYNMVNQQWKRFKGHKEASIKE